MMMATNSSEKRVRSINSLLSSNLICVSLIYDILIIKQLIFLPKLLKRIIYYKTQLNARGRCYFVLLFMKISSILIRMFLALLSTTTNALLRLSGWPLNDVIYSSPSLLTASQDIVVVDEMVSLNPASVLATTPLVARFYSL